MVGVLESVASSNGVVGDEAKRRRASKTGMTDKDSGKGFLHFGRNDRQRRDCRVTLVKCPHPFPPTPRLRRGRRNDKLVTDYELRVTGQAE